MTVQELMTLVQDHIPVKIALLRHTTSWHDAGSAGAHLRRQLHSSHLLGPDWLKLADAYGVAGFRATKPEEVDAAIAAARAVDGPALSTS